MIVNDERQPMLSLAALLNPAPATSGSAQAPPGVTVQHNVQLNRDTTLSEPWIYPKGHKPEYPATSPSDETSIGHLITMDESAAWSSPSLDFAYSLGYPRGARDNVMVYPLRDQDGNEVACRRTYSTCQGIKICPFASDSLRNQTHTAVTRESLKLYLDQEMLARHTPAQDILEKTLSLFVTFIDTGCPFPEQQSTQYSFQEQEERDMAWRTPTKAKRGQVKMGLCQGHIITDYTKDGRLFIRCEHYSATTRKHLVNYDAGNGLYNEVYLTALLENDTATVDSIE
ncbi:hypothetical protein C8J56DRAFT_1052446 [Mycena floridula]|nr:hypothetical protein C8J56DRAFT_1052446 [Mycena floridula]